MTDFWAIRRPQLPRSTTSALQWSRASSRSWSPPLTSSSWSPCPHPRQDSGSWTRSWRKLPSYLAFKFFGILSSGLDFSKMSRTVMSISSWGFVFWKTIWCTGTIWISSSERPRRAAVPYTMIKIRKYGNLNGSKVQLFASSLKSTFNYSWEQSVVFNIVCCTTMHIMVQGYNSFDIIRHSKC